ncbi:MAG: glycosyltransferase [Chloroflexi bacterium]|nr:glycosyltransferase [Chloroflexota bacterium]
MTRLAFLTVHSCPLGRLGERDAGGMSVYVLSLGRELHAAGYCIDIFTREHPGWDEEGRTVEASEGVRVIHLPASPAEGEKEDIYPHLPEFAEHLQRFAESNRLDYALVHSHYWLSGLVGVALQEKWRVPHVASFHTLAEVKLRALVGAKEDPRRSPSERAVMLAADRIVAFTSHERERMAQLYQVPPEKIAVVPAGVSLREFYPLDKGEARWRLGLPAEAQVLLFAGRVEPLKGVDLLLQAVALLEDRERVRVLIVGGDQRTGELARLAGLAETLGLKEAVSFPGSVPHEEMVWYYNAADIVVVPSYYESFGLVAAEALACGTPVVASKVGGLPTVVRDGVAGYLVDQRCPEAFLEPLDLLLGNEALRRSLGAAARASVERLDWSLVAERLLALYRELGVETPQLVPCD